MSARAGLRCGAGLVTLFSPPGALLVNAIASTAVMVKPFADAEALQSLASSCDCCLIGPAAGVNDATRENVLTVLETAASAVLDADALTVFQDSPDVLYDSIQGPVVLTPHPGEFKRVFPGLLEHHGRETAASEAATKSGSVILLKGAQTVIASPDGRLVRNDHASPFLATAGSGDVLAGVIGGLMAQGMAPFDAACAASWIHGETGRRLGPGLIAEDLPESLPGILKTFYEERP